MAGLREADGPLGPPWSPSLHGRLDTLVVESELLAGNPLGDPARRPLYVYRTPAVEARGETEAPLVYDVPSVYVLQAFGGQLDRWLARDALQPTAIERLDAMFAASELPEAVVVFVDAWTSLGGSQFLNSPATGRYLDYLCDEVVPFVDARYPTDPARRGITGHSSGGYGALVVPMLRPGVFSALYARAPDALFEYCHLPTFAAAVRALRDHFGGSLTRFREAFAAREGFDPGRLWPLIEVCAYASAYSPDLTGSGEFRLPFDARTGRLDEEVWAQWLAWDPVRMVAGHAEGLRGLRRVGLEAGRWDEAHLDLGAQALSAELSAASVEHTLELFDGGHGGVAHRFPPAVGELLVAL
jgi:enterochelin esterase-like enzyme